MKKWICVLLSVLVILSAGALLCSAVALEDGRYEMPLTVLDDKKDKESFGNRFVQHTALVEVENGKKYVTIIMTSDAEKMNFWYFTDGSAKGDAQKATLVKDVTIAGTKYDNGFRFPLMGDETKVGIKFHAEGMPITPVARIGLDYSKAVCLTVAETEEVTEAVEETTTEAPEETTEVAEPVTEQTVPDAEPETVVTEEEPVTGEDALMTIQNPANRTWVYFVAIGIAVVVAVVIILVRKKKSK